MCSINDFVYDDGDDDDDDDSGIGMVHFKRRVIIITQATDQNKQLQPDE